MVGALLVGPRGAHRTPRRRAALARCAGGLCCLGKAPIEEAVHTHDKLDEMTHLHEVDLRAAALLHVRQFVTPGLVDISTKSMGKYEKHETE